MTSPDSFPTSQVPDPRPVTRRVAVDLRTPVDAVVVTRGAHPYLEQVLDAVARQTLAPRTVTVVDVSDAQDAHLLVAARHDAGLFPTGTTVTTVAAPGAPSFSSGVTAALDALGTPGAGTARPGRSGQGADRESGGPVETDESWTWLLHDDSVPHATALEALSRAVEHAPSVGLAGAKQVRWREPDRLVEVGFTVSRGGRRLTRLEPGEVDQGQHDAREDVLAVGLAGALVRAEAWRLLGGADPVLGPFGDGLDVCVRARRAGYRVVVVPGAVVEHAQLSLRSLGVHDAVPEPAQAPVDADAGAVSAADADAAGPEPELEPEGDLDVPAADASSGHRLRSRRYWRVSSAAALSVPFLVVWFVVASVPRALWRVAVKQPRQAVAELAAPWWVVARLPHATVARVRGRRAARVPRRTLRPLFAGTREVLAADRSARLARAARRRLVLLGNDLVRAERRELARRRRGGLLVVALLLAATTVVAFRTQLAGVLHGRTLVGGALLPGSGGWEQWWQAVSSGWNEAGTGVSAPVDGFVTLLGPALVLSGGSLRLAVAGLFVFSLAVAGLGAWYACGALTRSVAVRVWAALCWVAVPALLVGSVQGRLGAMLAHAMLPWLALAVARTLGVQRRDEPGGHRRPGGGSLTALGAASLAFLAVVACAPVLLVPCGLGLVVAAVASGRRASRRSRAALWFVPLPALVVLGPTLLRAVVTWRSGGWRVLVADPGGLVPSDAAEPWRTLLGQPVLPASWPGVLGPVATVGPWLLGGLLVLLAVVALWRRGPHVRVARAGLLVALLGAAAAAVSAEVVVSVTDGTAVRGWVGAGVSLASLGLLVGACTALDGATGRVRTQAFGLRHLGLGVVVLVCAAVPLATLVDGAAVSDQHAEVTARSTVVVPAVGRQVQEAPRRARVLALESGGRTVGYQLLRADGTQVTDSSAVVAVDRLREADDPVAHVVAELVGGGTTQTAQVLHAYGIGAVLLPEGGHGAAELVSTLDSVDGLQRATEGTRDLVWRVVTSDDSLGQASWARVVTRQGGADNLTTVVVDQLLDSSATGVRDEVPAGSPDRIVTVAETAAPGWHARLDGTELARVPDVDGMLAFRLGSDGGTLTVGYERASRVWWLLLQGGVLLVFTLLALPVRRRRGGAR